MSEDKIPLENMDIPAGEVEDQGYKIKIDWSQCPVVYFRHYQHIFYRLDKHPHGKDYDMWCLSDCPYDMGTKMMFNATRYRLDECFAIWNTKKDDPIRLGGGVETQHRVSKHVSVGVVMMDMSAVPKDTWWVTQKEQELMKKWNDEFWTGMIWGFAPDKRTEEEKYKDTLKWAYVIIDNNRKMLMVSNKDMKAYKMDGYNLVEPLQEVTYNEFDRWCRSMDL